MAKSYYSEWDPFAAAWLRELIREGLIADGDVDERSIVDVRPADLAGYSQCHWFAGVGGWSLALRLAGIPDDYPIWTGSCPCQPFSAAGKRKGTADERHLWPEFYRLIRECQPAVVFGEQVASAEVIGKQGVQRMRKDAAHRAIPPSQQGWSQMGLPFLRESNGSFDQAVEFRRETAISARSSAPQARDGAGFRSQIAGEGTEYSIFTGLAGHSASHRPGAMRGDRDPVRSHYTTFMECSVARSDTAGCRIHDGERSGRSLCSKCGRWHMGVGSHHRDRGSIETSGALNNGPLSADCTAPQGKDQVWIDRVFTDLEGIHYSCGAAILGAHSVNSPHIRQRLYWVGSRVADSNCERRDGEPVRLRAGRPHEEGAETAGRGATDSRLADADEGQRGRLADGEGRQRDGQATGWKQGDGVAESGGDLGRLADADEPGPQGHRDAGERAGERAVGVAGGAGGVEHATGDGRQQRGAEPSWRRASGGCGDGHWSRAVWLPCADGKARRVPAKFKSILQRVAPGLPAGVDAMRPEEGFPLAYNVQNRVGLLRGYGNAIVPQVGAEFIRAYLDVIEGAAE